MNLQEPAHGPGVRILVAEDAPINRKVLQMLFAQRSLNAEFVENGVQAVERIASGVQFDIIFMDIEMPGMNGHDATRQIRSLGCGIPIIAMSGHSDEEEKRKSREAGMNGYVTKPLDLPKLFSLIENTQNGLENSDAFYPTFHFPKEAPVLDLSYLHSLSRGNSDFERHMLNIFMEDVPPQMKELRRAVSLANAQQASEVCHKMKSSFKMLGIEIGADLLQQIEDETRNGQLPPAMPERVEAVSGILQQSLAEIGVLLNTTV